MSLQFIHSNATDDAADAL